MKTNLCPISHLFVLFSYTVVLVRIFSVMYDHTFLLSLKAIRSDIGPQVKWAVNLVIIQAILIFLRGMHLQFITPKEHTSH